MVKAIIGALVQNSDTVPLEFTFFLMTSLSFQNEIAITICPRMRVYFKKGAIRWTRFNGHIKKTSQKASFKKIVIS